MGLRSASGPCPWLSCGCHIRTLKEDNDLEFLRYLNPLLFETIRGAASAYRATVARARGATERTARSQISSESRRARGHGQATTLSTGEQQGEPQANREPEPNGNGESDCRLGGIFPVLYHGKYMGSRAKAEPPTDCTHSSPQVAAECGKHETRPRTVREGR